MNARKICDQGTKIAARLPEFAEEDLEWKPGQFSVRGAPNKSVGL